MANARAIRTSEVDPFSHDATAAALERLTALVEAQARTIREYEAGVAHSRYIFDNASAAARLGLWECDLTTETLSWSNGTYDLFELPRGVPLVRKQTLKCYPAELLKALECVRSRALAERRGFSLDAAIVTPKGSKRWIRIHATVDCAGDRPFRLFGIKQDITEEKERWERTRYLAEFDEMTGLANRNKFKTHLEEACRCENGFNPTGALLLIDLDGFKDVNDLLGHTTGDECLKETARRLTAVCREAGLVARIGGDEFAVILETPRREEAIALATRIIAAMKPPIAHGGHWFNIGASVGIAAIDGCRPVELYRRADTALYAAKAGGRMTFRVFEAAAAQA